MEGDLGDRWKIEGPTKRPVVLLRMTNGDFWVDDVQTMTAGQLPEGITVAWFGESVLDLRPGDSVKVNVVTWIEKGE